MKQPSSVQEYSMHFQQLLFQVRTKVLEAGCADRLDADAWLANWLITPNPALGGALPRDVFARGQITEAKVDDITAELMGKPEQPPARSPVKHW